MVEYSDYESHENKGLYKDKDKAELLAKAFQKKEEEYTIKLMSEDGFRTPEQAKEDFVYDWYEVVEYEVIE